MPAARPATYAAVLQRYAARLNSKPLADITLAHVLAGDTCEPISLADFEGYLEHQEHTPELLQFVVWYQDYRARFFALPPAEQAASPGPHASDFTHSLPSPAQLSALSAPASPASPSPSQPFRAELARIVATFLRPDAPRELPLDPALRTAALRALAASSHPAALAPVYAELVALLAAQSLPRFLALAAANVNRPKQLLWYAVGAADLAAAALVLVACCLWAGPGAARAWRLCAVPFAALGSMQAYSAWRGFCSQVWGRGATQLRAWELAELDRDAAAHWARAADSPVSPVSPQPADSAPDSPLPAPPPALPVPPPALLAERDAEKGAGAHVLDAIAPFERMCPPPARPREKDRGRACPPRLRIRASAPRLRPAMSVEDPPLARPPVFGPERVVMDPRVRAVHRRVMRDILLFGTGFTAAFAALALAVPGRR